MLRLSYLKERDTEEGGGHRKRDTAQSAVNGRREHCQMVSGIRGKCCVV